jgi:hypothetical protein
MQLDQQMLLCFWGKESVCKNDELSRTFLRSLALRDRMRFLGLVSKKQAWGCQEVGRLMKQGSGGAGPSGT